MVDDFALTQDKFEKICSRFGGRVDTGAASICHLKTTRGEMHIKLVDRRDYAGNYYVELSHTINNGEVSHSVNGYFKHCGINKDYPDEAVFVCRGLDDGEDVPVYEQGYFEIRITKDDVNYLARANAVGRADLVKIYSSEELTSK